MYGTPAVDTDRYLNLLYEWGPRVLAAIAILVIAHFVAKAIKALLARGFDKLPGASHHNKHRNKDGTVTDSVGSRLGDVGYWLVLLAGVIISLNVLKLDAVTEPLNGLLATFLGYLPRIVGAIVTFFIGYVVATLAKRVVESLLTAANLDHWLDKLGLRRLTGASGLAKTVGTIVFVLIIVPVAIAALNILNIAAISEPAIGVLNTILAAVPHIIAAAILLIIGYAIGRWVASLIEQILPSFGFDTMVSGLLGPGAASGGATPPPVSSSTVRVTDTAVGGTETPAQAASRSASTMTPSKVVANVALVGIVLFFAVQAAHFANFGALADFLTEILSLFSRILFGGAIIVAGVAIANFLSGLMKRGGGQSGQFASTIVKYAAIALAVAIGLRFMGLANEIVILAFGLILGSGAVAAAVAFGVGGIQPARQMLEKMVNKTGQPPQP